MIKIELLLAIALVFMAFTVLRGAQQIASSDFLDELPIYYYEDIPTNTN